MWWWCGNVGGANSKAHYKKYGHKQAQALKVIDHLESTKVSTWQYLTHGCICIHLQFAIVKSIFPEKTYAKLNGPKPEYSP